MTDHQKHEFQELTEQVRRAKREIIEFPRGIHLPLTLDKKVEGVTMWVDHWTRLEKNNVEIRVCSLSTRTRDKTIANVFMGQGGYIENHVHDRREVIHVMDGAYVDPVTGKVYRSGDRQTVAPLQEHGIRSDYVLLSITWEPAYSEVAESCSV